MPSWISKGGVWGPKHERVYDSKKDEIYEGPDRAALDVLKEENLDNLGMPVADDPQVLEIAQRLGLTIEQYLERYKATPKQKALQEEAAKEVQDHKDPPKKRGVNPKGGGVTIRGGFGEITA